MVNYKDDDLFEHEGRKLLDLVLRKDLLFAAEIEEVKTSATNEIEQLERLIQVLLTLDQVSTSQMTIAARMLERFGGDKNQLTSDLRDHKTKAEKNAREREPLVQAGAAIRLRFWEQSKAVTFETAREGLNHSVIEAGNVAAHEMDMAADIALFDCGFLQGSVNKDNFNQVYGAARSLMLESGRFVAKHRPGYIPLFDGIATGRWKIPKGSEVTKTPKWKDWADLSLRLLREFNSTDQKTKKGLPPSEKIQKECQRLQALSKELMSMERATTGRLAF